VISLETAILSSGPTLATFGMPNELLPLLGRSLTQRAVETIVGAGIREVHVILGEDPQATRSLLADGTRWGCQIHYHHVLQAEPVSALVRRLGLCTERVHLVADATRLPLGIHGQLSRSADGASAVWTCRAEGSPAWTGWARLGGDWLAHCDLPLASEAFAEHLLNAVGINHLETAQLVSVATPRDLLQAAGELLARQAPSVIVSHGSRVDPTAQLTEPVWIGRNVRIGRDARIGPGVAIGDGAHINAGSLLSTAMVLPDTFIGDGLAVEDAIAGRGRLASVRHGTVVEVTDPHLLSHAARDSEIGAAGWRERALAVALKFALAPLRLAIGGRWRGPALRIPLTVDSRASGAAVSLSMADPAEVCGTEGRCEPLRHFRECFYPGLSDVAAGRLRLLGPTPRSRESLATLPEQWRLLYGGGRPGLLQEGLLAPGRTACSELPMASDAVAAATRDDPTTRRRLLRRYLRQVVGCLLGHWTGARCPDYANGRSGT
jgi:hypothetical protein